MVPTIEYALINYEGLWTSFLDPENHVKMQLESVQYDEVAKILKKKLDDFLKREI